MSAPSEDRKPVYDRALLLHGSKRNEVLTLEEVRQYGIDSFSDPDYVRIYGMLPSAWYGQGIRLLGRTAVECTRDALGNRIGRDIASIATHFPKPHISPSSTRLLARATRSTGSCDPSLTRRASPVSSTPGCTS
jgi:hypothetical protein